MYDKNLLQKASGTYSNGVISLYTLTHFGTIYIITSLVKKKKCEQYWPDEVDASKEFEQMSVKFVAESKVQSQSGQRLNDLIHRTLEVTNVKSGNQTIP